MRIVGFMVAMALTAGCMAADAPATQTSGPLHPDSSVDQVLTALRDVGANLRDFTADVTMAETDNITGDSTKRRGTVWYQLKSPGDGRIRVDFTVKQVGEMVFRQERTEYVLDDRWLIERDYKRKLEVKREVLKPGQKINLLKLGEGPFPLPIGQDPAEVRKQFDVEKIAAAKEDPANTIHLKLTPRKENEQFARRFKTVDVWVALANPFPRRIETIDPKQKTIRTTDLSPKAVNSGLRDEQFKLEPINEKEWQSREEPFSP